MKIDKSVIENDDLASLLRAAYKLRCLEAGGVDNWDNYTEALKEGGYSSYCEKPDDEVIEESSVFTFGY